MKFAFVTCVQLGLSCIQKIYKIGGKLDLLITLHDHKAHKKAGRIYLNEFAGKNNIPLVKINHINDLAAIEAIKNYEIDWLFIIGWSQIAGKSVLEAPRLGALGIHPTLLPQGRGRSAIPWAIIKNLEYTGVTMFKLSEDVDTGPIVEQIKILIAKDETASTLYKKVNIAHETLMAIAYPKLFTGKLNWKEQDESDASYWEGRNSENDCLTNDMTVEYAEKIVRAVTHPYPGAYVIQNNQKIIIWKARISYEKPVSGIWQSFKNGYLIFEDFEIQII